ncbi:MAG: NAD(P)-dependent alcohol dehydrogenase, partial [Verrucomicrobiaceae bacterium]|nr:NAD(P)-dependent alcohol dehydrogenase [Verrucomicrobiaceae bacterium]
MKLKRIFKWSAGVLLLVLFGWFQIAYWTSTNDCNAQAQGELMKAIKVCEYGGPKALQLADVARPVPSDKQILVRVHAASLNPVDGHMIRDSVIKRLISVSRKPRQTAFGIDCAGTVEAVGKEVTQLKPADEVFGASKGTLAEYVCGSEHAFVTKPNNITFEQAASVPVAALTALQGLRDHGKIKPGQEVLINGASGGVGTFAVQIAKAYGAEVTGVCSTRNVDLVRSLGADHVIDYTKEDFTQRAERYDMIFDNVNNHSFDARRRILKPNGTCVLVGIGGAGWQPGKGKRIMGALMALIRSQFTEEKFVGFIAKTKRDDLAALRDLMQEGKV